MEESQINLTIDEIRSALESGDVLDAIAALIRLHPADRAEAFSDLKDTEQASILPGLDVPTTADLLEELENPEAADVAEGLARERLADVLDKMEPDEAADVLGDISPQLAAEVLAKMEDAEEVLPLLEHADETAGGLMTTSFIALQPNTTTVEAIEFLRGLSPDEETPYYLNVVDHDGLLVGIVGLRELVIADPHTRIETIMDHDVIHVTTDTDQEDAARLMVRYDLAALPVVTEKGFLVGVITYDDLMDVLEAEATEDIYRLANVPDPELSVESPVRLSVKRRLPWLLVSAATAFFASWVISRFESIIAQVAMLAVFQSVVSGLGGNSATQSLAIMVRAIALGEIQLRDSWRMILKEAFTGLLQGTAVGLVAGLGVYLWKGNPTLGFVLGLALLGNIFIAGIVGTTIPLVLKALNMDPALASSVLVTTVTDSAGFALFLGLATYFLPYLK
jgi:magnesium transporter